MIGRRTFLCAAAVLPIWPRMGSAEETYFNASIILDAEALAEAGMKQAYEGLLPELRKFVAQPQTLDEEVGANGSYYRVRAGGKTYVIYEESSDNLFELWAQATVAFFEIVNSQLEDGETRFLAIYSGNDLAGVFLTRTEVDAIRRRVETREDWPYIPDMIGPWYGQYHSPDVDRPWYQALPEQ